MRVMLIRTRKRYIDILKCWFISNEVIELYLRRNLSRDDFDILHVASFTIRKKV